ncbi:MAG: SDR family oxidoreductase [Acidobacteria bacterium]|nr:SDR family oxidoreductase [Acidobacteriota bacterium]
MGAPFRLDQRRAVVTGGASGIGEATSRALAAAGASVTIVDLERERALALAAEIGPGASAAGVDVTDEEAVRQFFSGLARLDILVNNAGIGFVGSIEETPFADWDRLFRVNVDAVYFCSKHALPLLLASGRGQIVNIGSVAGLTAVKRRFAYCATKGAVIALTRQMAIDYAGRIRVNCICPGTVHTPFVEGYLERFHQHEKDKVRAELHARQPIGRMGRPDEVAYMVVYVCSDQAEYVTGSILTIDGGWTAQ